MPRSAKAGMAAQMMPASSGRPGPGDSSTASGASVERLVDGELVVADDHRVGAQLAEVLDEVVDEAVVAVDHENPRSSHPDSVDSSPVAPPKRKTSGGRTTPKGTRPGEATRLASHGHAHEHAYDNGRAVEASSRYTPPVADGSRSRAPGGCRS